MSLEDIDKRIADLNREIELNREHINKSTKIEQKPLEAPKYKAPKQIIQKKSLVDFKGFYISPIGWTFKLGFIPVPPFMNKNFKTLIVYFTRNRNIKFIGLNKDIDTTLEYLSKELYIINNNKKYEIYNYMGKSILWLHPDSVINLQIDILKEEMLCDSNTFHNLINNVVEYRLTKASGFGGMGDLLSKYWWVLLVGAGLYLASQQEGGIAKFFGL